MPNGNIHSKLDQFQSELKGILPNGNSSSESDSESLKSQISAESLQNVRSEARYVSWSSGMLPVGQLEYIKAEIYTQISTKLDEQFDKFDRRLNKLEHRIEQVVGHSKGNTLRVDQCDHDLGVPIFPK